MKQALWWCAECGVPFVTVAAHWYPIIAYLIKAVNMGAVITEYNANLAFVCGIWFRSMDHQSVMQAQLSCDQSTASLSCSATSTLISWPREIRLSSSKLSSWGMIVVL